MGLVSGLGLANLRGVELLLELIAHAAAAALQQCKALVQAAAGDGAARVYLLDVRQGHQGIRHAQRRQESSREVWAVEGTPPPAAEQQGRALLVREFACNLVPGHVVQQHGQFRRLAAGAY